MRLVTRITSRSTASTRQVRKRRGPVALSLTLAGALLLGIACSDQLPTEAKKKTPGSVARNISQGEGAVIATDKTDYAPGETVLIDGWTWTPGETVRLQIVHTDSAGDNSKPSHQPWDVTADENGVVVSSWLVAEGEGGASFRLTADGQTSGAHAEIDLTDLDGTVALYADQARTTSQTAFPWNSTVYARVSGSIKKSTCYKFTWTSPTSVVTEHILLTGDPPPAILDTAQAVGQVSGTWRLVVNQKEGPTCSSGTYGSATSPLFFDVARAVVIGAGTPFDDDSTTGGDQCIAQGTLPTGGCGATTGSIWVRSSAPNNVRSVLRFNLATSTPSIPAGVVVNNATVRFTLLGFSTSVGPKIYIQRASASWDEGLATFAGVNTTGPLDSAFMPTAEVSATGGMGQQTWARWNVTSGVQSFVSGTANYGWRIWDSGEGVASSLTRFSSTENTCTTGSTCNRLKPVLLVDYSDPPHLAFLTTAFSGEVGQCLGPIRVQSQDFANSPLVVSSNLTVNLSTANLGTGGAGSFFSNASCTTGSTTTTITTGNTNSADFYYRATGRGDGGHDVVASATGYTPNASQTQTIDKATTTLIYTGDRLILVGNAYNYSAVLTSAWEPCTENKRIIFRLMPSPLTGSGFFDPAPDTTDTNGVVGKSVATTGWLEDIYDGRSNFVGDANCEASKDDYPVSVIEPGGAATGGGFLAGSKVGGGRANFGFTVRQIEGSSPIAYKGQFLMIKQEGGVPQFRCKGNIDTYGSVPNTTPQMYAASGTCDFQLWDPALDGGLGDWYVPAGPGYAGQTFTFYFVDNGSGKGKNAPPPDKFGFTIGFVGPGDDPSFAIADINGGNIDVKTGGTTTTTTDGGSTGGRGKNK